MPEKSPAEAARGEIDPNDLIRAIAEATYGHLARRFCTRNFPMPMEQKDAFRWSHPDAVERGAVLNLVTCQCPHCGLTFNCLPRSHG